MIGKEMNNPLVSILIPVYNVEAYLPKCLDTVLGQTYSNLQVVLIDDGSKDGSWNLMQEYAARDNRAEIYHQENQGVAATRNGLLEKVKGEYVLFVDSDDWIEMDMVEYLVEQIKTEDVDMAVCSNVLNDQSTEQKEIHKEVWDQEKTILEFMRHVSLNGSLWNKLFKSRLLHNLKFHCGISYGEDALFCWDILQKVSKVVVTDKLLYHYRMNNASLSHAAWSPEKKGTGHIVWGKITEETQKLWPEYLDIARARYAIEDMWALFFASMSGYGYDDNIHLRQQNVRNNLRLIRKSGLINGKKILTAYALAYYYRVGKLLRLFI